MSYKAQRRFRGTTNYGRPQRLRNLGVLSGTVFTETAFSGTVFSDSGFSDGFGDDEVTSQSIAQEKANAGCTPLEIAASVGTSPWNACEAKIAAYRKRSSGSTWDWLSSGGGIVNVPKTPAPSSSPSAAGSIVSSVIGALTAPRGGAYPYPYPYPQQQGMSTGTTMALLGGGALLLYVLMRD